mgnify:CR=1 FL=1|jgi:DNA-directed RNA polymerase specialized sigma24 family protein
MRSFNERVTAEGVEKGVRAAVIDGRADESVQRRSVAGAPRAPASGNLKLRRRAGSDLVLERAHLLDPADQRLIEAIYARGVTAVAMSRLMGQPPRKLTSRVRRLVKHLCSPECALVQAMESRLPKVRREVARACFVQGLSIRAASARVGITFYAARQHLAAVRALAEVAA